MWLTSACQCVTLEVIIVYYSDGRLANSKFNGAIQGGFEVIHDPKISQHKDVIVANAQAIFVHYGDNLPALG